MSIRRRFATTQKLNQIVDINARKEEAKTLTYIEKNFGESSEKKKNRSVIYANVKVHLKMVHDMKIVKNETEKTYSA